MWNWQSRYCFGIEGHQMHRHRHFAKDAAFRSGESVKKATAAEAKTGTLSFRRYVSRCFSGKQVGLIIFPYSSLLELRSTKDVALAVKHAFHSLRRGGTLVVDNFLYGESSPDRPNGIVRQGRVCPLSNGLKVQFSETDWHDASARTTERWLYTDVLDSRSITVDRRTWLIQRLYVEPEQMRWILLKAGFHKENIQLFGTFDERTPIEHPCFLETGHALFRKARQVWVCRKHT